MIIRGIAATPDAAISGVVPGGAFDCSSDVALLHRHDRPIGKVLGLFYSGDNLHAISLVPTMRRA